MADEQDRTAGDPLPSFTPGSAFRDAGLLLRGHFGLLVTFAAVGGLLQALLGAGGQAAPPSGETAGTGPLVWIFPLLGILVPSFFLGGLIGGLHRLQLGEAIAWGDLFRMGAALFPGVLAVVLLSSLGIAVGFVLLVVPGLYLATRWLAVLPVAVIERPGVLASFRRSAQLVRGRGWDVFAFVLLGFLLLIAVQIAVLFAGGLLVSLLTAVFPGFEQTGGPLLLVTLAHTASLVLTALLPVAAYHRLLVSAGPA